jgi:hypothetical protein
VQVLYKIFSFDINQAGLLFPFVKNKNVAALTWLINHPIDFKVQENNMSIALMAHEVRWPEGLVLLNSLGKEGAALLHEAVKQHDSDLLKYGIEELGLDINTVIEQDCTPLMLAVQLGHKDLVVCLLQHQADVTCQNSQGETALAIAMRLANGELSGLLSIYSNPQLLQLLQLTLPNQALQAVTPSPSQLGLFATSKKQTQNAEPSADQTQGFDAINNQL